MLKTLRVVLALIFFGLITFLFVDFRNTGPEWYDFVAKWQIIPAICAASVVTTLALLALTLIFGRVYCSTLCPLGVLQDFMNRFYGLFLKKRRRTARFGFSKGVPVLRYAVFGLFAVVMILGIWYMGVRVWAALIEPYSAYGRIASSLFGPAYDWGNNLLADYSVKENSTTFWHVATDFSTGPVFYIACATFVVLFAMVIAAGRLWCNTLCPAGTLLGFLSRFSVLAPVINKSRCVGCRKCERDCKAQCIDIDHKEIDHSRCVTCFNCLSRCQFSALKYTLRYKPSQSAESETKG